MWKISVLKDGVFKRDLSIRPGVFQTVISVKLCISDENECCKIFVWEFPIHVCVYLCVSMQSVGKVYYSGFRLELGEG